MTLGCSLVLLLALPTLARAEAASEKASAPPTPARPIEHELPARPDGTSGPDSDGWVVASYVVEEDGSVKDILIDDADGGPEFERAVREALSKWRFEPATVDGQPVPECHNQDFFPFESESTKSGSTSSAFVRYFQDVSHMLDAGRLDDARERIDAMSSRHKLNLQEMAQISLLRGLLSAKLGDQAAQLRYFREAMVGDGRYLTPDAYKTVVQTTFLLEVNSQLYADALESYQKLKRLEDGKSVPKPIRRAAAQIEDLEKGTRPFSAEAVIGEAREGEAGVAHWSSPLLRRMPGVEPLEGEVSRVELRCERNRVATTPAPGKAWRIPESWGTCRVYVFGAPGARFRLVEYANAGS